MSNVYPRDKFGPTLRKLRKSRKMTIKQLAESMGLSIVYISEVERGLKQPTSAFLNFDYKEAMNLDAEEWFRLQVAALISCGGFTIHFKGEPTDAAIHFMLAVIGADPVFEEYQWFQAGHFINRLSMKRVEELNGT